MSDQTQITVVERRSRGCVVTEERQADPGDVGATVDALNDALDLAGDADRWIEVGGR